MNGDVCGVTLRGELDVENSEHVRRALVAMSGSIVVVDLSALTFIDSPGLTATVDAHDEITGGGRGFELRSASGSVQPVFEIAGVSKLFDSREGGLLDHPSPRKCRTAVSRPHQQTEA